MTTTFRVKAVDVDGRRMDELMQAESVAALRKTLAARRYALISAEPVDRTSPAAVASRRARLFGRAPSVKEIMLFTQQFRTLFSAGISLSEIFRILSRQSANAVLREAAADIERRVSEGQSLVKAFGAHPSVFSPLYCAMIDAGERSGAMEGVLLRLVSVMKHEEDVKQRIESALRYPKLVFGVMLAAFLVLLNFVVPQFARVYEQAGVVLPAVTRAAMAVNAIFERYGPICLLACAVLCWGATRWVKTPAGRLKKDALLLKTPVIGPVVAKSVTARFAAIFSICLRSGVSILHCVDILRTTVDNAYFERAFERLKVDLSEGESLAGALERAGCFSPLALSLIGVGERSAKLEAMMEALAQHYDAEVDVAVLKMTDYLGPALIVCLSVLVLFFALAIFMPMWDMVKFVQ